MTLKLVPHKISSSTVNALASLTIQAERGQLIGIAFAALYKGDTFIAASCGACHDDPMRSMGMAAVLHAKLLQLAVHGED